ncbi:MAG: methyltransferase domain-containing protein [Micrococcaceae bacterium]
MAKEKQPSKVLDIGCGDGLLPQKLAPFVKSVIAIEPDKKYFFQNRKCLENISNVTLIQENFQDFTSKTTDKFELIIFVASLHHMDLETPLEQVKELLAPKGMLLVVGLAGNKTILDWIISGLHVIPIRIADILHKHNKYHDIIGYKVADSKESLSEIRQQLSKLLPGANIKRAFYYRYLLCWNKQ